MRARFRIIFKALGVVGLLAAGCTGGDGDGTQDPPAENVCAPGQQISCPCPGGTMGAQVCRQDGQGYLACQGCPSSASSSSGAVGTSASASSEGASSSSSSGALSAATSGDGSSAAAQSSSQDVVSSTGSGASSAGSSAALDSSSATPASSSLPASSSSAVIPSSSTAATSAVPPSSSSAGTSSSGGVVLDPQEQLLAVRQTADGVVNIPVHGVVVTYVRWPVAAGDLGGFYVQAHATGPAVFVSETPSMFDPAPQPGDVVGFVVTRVGTVLGQRRALDITGYQRMGTAQLAPLVQDLSAAGDLVSNLVNYDAELIHLDATIQSLPRAAGTNYQAVTLTTAGQPTADGSVELRLPETLAVSLELRPGCTLTAPMATLNTFNTVAQLAVWHAQELQLDCPAAPAVLQLNEVSPSITDGCDLVELRVVQGGLWSGQGFTLAARRSDGGASTFPLEDPLSLGPTSVATGDILLVHLGLANLCPHSPSESTARNQQPAAAQPLNVDSAWDIHLTVGGLVNTANVLFLKDGAGNLQDALFLGNGTASPASDVVTRAGQAVATTPPAWVNTAGVVPVGGYTAANFQSVAASSLGTGTEPGGNSMQRNGPVDTNSAADWAVAVPTLGYANAGQ